MENKTNISEKIIILNDKLIRLSSMIKINELIINSTETLRKINTQLSYDRGIILAELLKECEKLAIIKLL